MDPFSLSSSLTSSGVGHCLLFLSSWNICLLQLPCHHPPWIFFLPLGGQCSFMGKSPGVKVLWLQVPSLLLTCLMVTWVTRLLKPFWASMFLCKMGFPWDDLCEALCMVPGALLHSADTSCHSDCRSPSLSFSSGSFHPINIVLRGGLLQLLPAYADNSQAYCGKMQSQPSFFSSKKQNHPK